MADPAGRSRWFTIDDFIYDEAAGTLTCPNGHTRSLTHTRRVTFGAACRGCPFLQRCTTSPHGRKIIGPLGLDPALTAVPCRTQTGGTTPLSHRRVLTQTRRSTALIGGVPPVATPSSPQNRLLQQSPSLQSGAAGSSWTRLGR